MARIDFDALKRQLEHKTHGYARRVALLARARQRIAIQIEAERAVQRASERAIAEFESDLADLDTLEKVHAVSRSRTVAEDVCLGETRILDRAAVARDFDERGLEYESGPVVVDRDMPQRTEAGGSIWRMPTALPAGETPAFEMAQTPAGKLRAHGERGLALAGYVHLAYLAQTQWMGNGVLDRAVELAQSRGVVGQALAADFIGHVVDGSVAGARGAEFWADRARRSERKK